MLIRPSTSSNSKPRFWPNAKFRKPFRIAFWPGRRGSGGIAVASYTSKLPRYLLIGYLEESTSRILAHSSFDRPLFQLQASILVKCEISQTIDWPGRRGSGGIAVASYTSKLPRYLLIGYLEESTSRILAHSSLDWPLFQIQASILAKCEISQTIQNRLLARKEWVGRYRGSVIHPNSNGTF